jgi:hypothetical protein
MAHRSAARLSRSAFRLALCAWVCAGSALLPHPAPAARKVYLKYIVKSDAQQFKKGAPITPRFSQTRLDTCDHRSVQYRVERLVERVRLQVAPEKPSRLNSVFATTDPSLWDNGLGQQSSRILVRLMPVQPAYVATVDARYYEEVFDRLVEFDRAKSFGEKRQILKQAEALARKYWTLPATGRAARADARPEVLLGGGGIFLGLSRR